MAVPSVIGDYKIESLLGEGGMAAVYRARHAVLDTPHALKVLDPMYRANAEARQRFLDEARIQAKHLSHPNVVKVTNIVATADYAALVMELVEGTSLESLIGKLQGKPDEIRAVMTGVLAGVEHAHQAGIIHRDLKPANVLLARDGNRIVPKVTDFGIAKVADRSDSGKKKSTRGDARMGTLDYMSPEQVRGAKHVTKQSDIFSLGVMLYELATGKLPFAADNDFDVMRNIVDGKFERPEVVEPRIDPQLAAVIVKAIAADPAARFQSCDQMARALVVSEPLHERLPPRNPPRKPPPDVEVISADDDDAAALPPRMTNAAIAALSVLGVALIAIVVVLAIKVTGADKPDVEASQLPATRTPAAQPAPTAKPAPAAKDPWAAPEAGSGAGELMTQPPVPAATTIGPAKPRPKPSPPRPTQAAPVERQRNSPDDLLAPGPIEPSPRPSTTATCDEVNCVLNNYAGACCQKYRNSRGSK